MNRFTMRLVRAVIIALALVGSAASAGDDRYGRGGHGDDTIYVEAPVVEVRPLVRVVEVSRPQRVCWEEEVEHTVRHGGGSRPSTGAVVGTIIGGAIGHNVADRGSRGAATAAGAALGAVIGRDISRPRRGPPRRVVTTEQRCEIERSVHEEERIDGYRVFYRYGGQTFQTRTDHDPGDTIRVRVQVTPTY